MRTLVFIGASLAAWTTVAALGWGFAYSMWGWTPTVYPGRLALWLYCLWAVSVVGTAVAAVGVEPEDRT